MSNVQKKKKSSAYEVAMQEILKLIRVRDMKSGDKLPTEKELAQMLNIGRSSVREALQVLAANYVIHIKQGSGIYVDILDTVSLRRFTERVEEDKLKQLDDVVAMRMLIETYGFQETAKVITEEQLKNLYGYIDKVLEKELSAYYHESAPLDFEQMIIDIQQNSLLSGFHNQINLPWRDLVNDLNIGKLSVISKHDGHKQILDAISTRNPEKIKIAVENHLSITKSEIKTIVNRSSN